MNFFIYIVAALPIQDDRFWLLIKPHLNRLEPQIVHKYIIWNSHDSIFKRFFITFLQKNQIGKLLIGSQHLYEEFRKFSIPFFPSQMAKIIC